MCAGIGRVTSSVIQNRRPVSADATHAHVWQAWGVMEEEQGNEFESEKGLRKGCALAAAALVRDSDCVSTAPSESARILMIHECE
jgi:hypothetical protein